MGLWAQSLKPKAQWLRTPSRNPELEHPALHVKHVR
jgi:hypothetical protein